MRCIRCVIASIWDEMEWDAMGLGVLAQPPNRFESNVLYILMKVCKSSGRPNAVEFKSMGYHFYRIWTYLAQFLKFVRVQVPQLQIFIATSTLPTVTCMDPDTGAPYRGASPAAHQHLVVLQSGAACCAVCQILRPEFSQLSAWQVLILICCIASRRVVGEGGCGRSGD